MTLPLQRWLAALMVVTAGCRPAAPAATAPTVAAVTVERYMDGLRRLFCAYVTCELGLAASEECRVTEEFLGQIERSLASGRRMLDPAAAAACLEAVATLDGHDCWGERVTPGWARMQDALLRCERAAPGTLPAGAPCFDVSECADGWCDLSTCPGSCAAFAAPGASCAEGSFCAPGSLCVAADDGAARCVVTAGPGATCTDDRPCELPYACLSGVCAAPEGVVSGTSCRGDSDCGPDARCHDGGCIFKSGVGDPCSAGASLFPSASPDCRGVLVCAGVEFDDAGAVKREGRCAVPSEVREPCYPDAVEFFEGVALNTSADGCFFGLVCDPATRRCAHGPVPGEPCLAGRCEQDAYCDGTVCRAFHRPGERCRSALECFGGCVEGVCAEPPPNVACPAP